MFENSHIFDNLNCKLCVKESLNCIGKIIHQKIALYLNVGSVFTCLNQDCLHTGIDGSLCVVQWILSEYDT